MANEVQTSADGTVTITNIDQDGRFFLAMRTLRVRLRFAIRAGRTDSFALQSARGWAEKAGYTGSLKTMKQALRWVESQC
jgi:hypothetical protein